MMEKSPWREIYDGGSPEAEHDIFLVLANEMVHIQESNRLKRGEPRAARTLHAKTVVGIEDAKLVVDRSLPTAFAQSGLTLAR